MNDKKISLNYLRLYSLYKLEKIEGSLKFEKVLFEMRDSLINKGYNCGHNLVSIRDNFGPRDPGLSRALLKYETMDLIEIEKEIEKDTSLYKITIKGKAWMEGLNKYYHKTIDKFSEIRSTIDQSIEENRYLSGNQIVKKDSVQEAKKELWGKKL